MFTLDCHITVGNYVFTHVNQVRIDSGRKKLVDTCVIRLPRRYKSSNLTEVIKEGDEVNVRLGYNGRLYDEFAGYIIKIGCNTPVEMECEDRMYKLKRASVKAKSWKTVKLRDIIAYLVPGSVVEVNDISLSNYTIKGLINTAKILESLKDQYNLDIYYRPDGKLYVGIGYWETQKVNTAINYNTQLNVVSQDLKFRRGDAVRVKVKMMSHQPNGKVIKYEFGDPDGEVRSHQEYNMSLDDMKKIAETRIAMFKFDGLEGSMQAFGEPFIRHGQAVTIHDPLQPDHDGTYLTDAVNTTFGTGGFRRDIYLGKKVSNG